MQRPQHLQPHCAQRSRAFAAVEFLPNQLQLARGGIGTAALAAAAQGAQIQPKKCQCFFRFLGKQRREDVDFVPRIQPGRVVKIPLCHPDGHAAHAAVHIAVVVVGYAELAPAIEAIVEDEAVVKKMACRCGHGSGVYLIESQQDPRQNGVNRYFVISVGGGLTGVLDLGYKRRNGSSFGCTGCFHSGSAPLIFIKAWFYYSLRCSGTQCRRKSKMLNKPFLSECV